MFLESVPASYVMVIQPAYEVGHFTTCSKSGFFLQLYYVIHYVFINLFISKFKHKL